MKDGLLDRDSYCHRTIEELGYFLDYLDSYVKANKKAKFWDYVGASFLVSSLISLFSAPLYSKMILGLPFLIPITIVTIARAAYLHNNINSDNIPVWNIEGYRNTLKREIQSRKKKEDNKDMQYRKKPEDIEYITQPTLLSSFKSWFLENPDGKFIASVTLFVSLFGILLIPLRMMDFLWGEAVALSLATVLLLAIGGYIFSIAMGSFMEHHEKRCKMANRNRVGRRG